MKRYDDCIMENSECRKCSLSSYERDCHNSPVNPLTYYRTLRGLSQYDLADLTGIVRPQLSKYETGERDLRTAQAITVLRIAHALDVPMEALLIE